MPATFLLLLCAWTPALQAQSSTEGGTREASDVERPLIERSVVVAPRTIDGFTFDSYHYDPDQRIAGVRFRYALEDHQETRFDVFVYPVGRMPQAEAIESGMIAFKQDIKAASDAGVYKDVTFAQEDSFPLDEEPIQTAPTEQVPEEAEVLAALAGTRKMGKRLRMHYTQTPGDFPMQSNGYLFYRHLYYYKARISAARDRIDEHAFQALADRSARTLVRAIQTFNSGGCEKKEITLDPKADVKSMGAELVRQSALLEDYNCNGEPDAKTLAGPVQVVRIDFLPSDWRAE